MDVPYDIPDQRNYALYDYQPRDLSLRTNSEGIGNTSKILAALFALAHAADWAQTQHISRNPEKFYEKEMDMFMGRHPSEGRVNGVMAIEGLIKGLGPLFLPSGYREGAQALTIGGKANVINQNRKIGIGLKF
jgi:hypothetical protein